MSPGMATGLPAATAGAADYLVTGDKRDPLYRRETWGHFKLSLPVSSPGRIGVVVLVETAQVLQRLLRASAEETRELVTDLLGSPAVVIENRDLIARALAILNRTPVVSLPHLSPLWR